MGGISGISAAWDEKAGRGYFEIRGKMIYFYNDRGWTKQVWTCKSPADAERQLKLFRAATKYPKTKKNVG